MKDCLSTDDLYFLSLVMSGAVELEKIEVDKSDRGVGILYVPARRALARNLMLLSDLRREVVRQVEQLEEALQKPLLPSRMEQKCSVQFFLTTPGGAVFFYQHNSKILL